MNIRFVSEKRLPDILIHKLSNLEVGEFFLRSLNSCSRTPETNKPIRFAENTTADHRGTC